MGPNERVRKIFLCLCKASVVDEMLASSGLSPFIGPISQCSVPVGLATGPQRSSLTQLAELVPLTNAHHEQQSLNTPCRRRQYGSHSCTEHRV